MCRLAFAIDPRSAGPLAGCSRHGRKPGGPMSTLEVKVPDIGDFKDVPVIEVFVKPGDVRPTQCTERVVGATDRGATDWCRQSSVATIFLRRKRKRRRTGSQSTGHRRLQGCAGD